MISMYENCIMIRKYGCGTAELWHDGKKIALVGNFLYESELLTIKAVGRAFEFEVRVLNYEENEQYEAELQKKGTE